VEFKDRHSIPGNPFYPGLRDGPDEFKAGEVSSGPGWPISLSFSWSSFPWCC